MINFEWHDEDFCPTQTGLIRRGDLGDDVKMLQTLLKQKGYNISVDGNFGPATEAIVIQYQRAVGLIADGIAGPKTVCGLIHGTVSKFLTQSDIEEAARKLGVSVASVMAVSEVESTGDGFFDDGRAKILYERHIMRRRLVALNVDVAPLIAKYPDLVNTTSGGYLGGVREYGKLDRAKVIHHAAAHESCSWGGYQIMGYHYDRLGYDSIDQFVELMQSHERDQLDAFVRFIMKDPTLHRALRQRDWPTFARYYNGKNYAKYKYDIKMAQAFARYEKLLAA